MTRPFAANRAPTHGRVGQNLCVREVQTRPALPRVSSNAIANMKESLVGWRTDALVAPKHGAVVTCKPGATLAPSPGPFAGSNRRSWRLFAHPRVDRARVIEVAAMVIRAYAPSPRKRLSGPPRTVQAQKSMPTGSTN